MIGSCLILWASVGLMEMRCLDERLTKSPERGPVITEGYWRLRVLKKVFAFQVGHLDHPAHPILRVSEGFYFRKASWRCKSS